MTKAPFDLSPGSPVILYLQAPKEKVWGLLVSVGVAGIVVRGLDLTVFEDWMRQEARRDEPLIGLTTVFYPVHRIERMEKDETVGPVVSYAERFERAVGFEVERILDRRGASGRGRTPKRSRYGSSRGSARPRR